MDAREAASTLGVSRSTLYAYVSRGLVRASSEAETRHSRYRRSEIERLALERRRARKPALVARASLDWGRPVLNSALTLIAEGRLYYRGRDAVELAADATLEQAAALLWNCAPGAPTAPAPPAVDLAPLRALAGLADTRRCTAAFAWLVAVDATVAVNAVDTVDAVDAGAASCTRLLRLMTAVMSGRAPTRAPIHRQLARAWGLDERGGELLRRALVLCADHELNASSFAARCVASTGADLGACVLAGLTALSGSRHGGVTALVEDLWTRSAPSAAAANRVASALAGALERTRLPAAGHLRGSGLPGFGHPLYPDGDPRAQAILEALPSAQRHPRLCGAVHDRTGLRPSLDYALVALRRHLGLPEGHAYRLFALGRTVGWIAHVLEQRRDNVLIRPRAAYVGERPDTAIAASPPPSAPASRIIRRR